MYSIVMRLSRLMAYLGGTVLTALVVMTCISILGRTLSGFLNSDLMQVNFESMADALLAAGVGPIKGDFELVEAGMAFVIFAFLPICQITSGHALVDVFTSRMSARTNRFLAAISEALFALVLIVITVQLYSGMQSKIASGQTTFLLEFPIWWAYLPSLIASVFASVAAVYMAFARIREMTTGQSIIPDQAGASH